MKTNPTRCIRSAVHPEKYGAMGQALGRGEGGARTQCIFSVAEAEAENTNGHSGMIGMIFHDFQESFFRFWCPFTLDSRVYIEVGKKSLWSHFRTRPSRPMGATGG